MKILLRGFFIYFLVSSVKLPVGGIYLVYYFSVKDKPFLIRLSCRTTIAVMNVRHEVI